MKTIKKGARVDLSIFIKKVPKSFTRPQLYSTSSVFLAKVRKPPDISESNTESENCEEELNRAVPGHPRTRSET